LLVVLWPWNLIVYVCAGWAVPSGFMKYDSEGANQHAAEVNFA